MQYIRTEASLLSIWVTDILPSSEGVGLTMTGCFLLFSITDLVSICADLMSSWSLQKKMKLFATVG